MNTWLRLRSFRSVVKLRRSAAFSSARVHSSVQSCPALAQLCDARRLHVEADGLVVLAELNRERQAHVTQSDDADATLS